MIGIGIGVNMMQRGGDAIAAALATRAGIDWRPWEYATTLFTDTAGTVAATGPGDVIAVQKSPSKAGLQFQQTTLANRPILVRHPKSGRRNLLTYSEQFDNAVWTKLQTTISANAQTAPDGTLTADTLLEVASTAVHQIFLAAGVSTTISVPVSFSVSLKEAGRRYAKVICDTAGLPKGVFFDLQAGTVGTADAGYTGTIEAQDNGFFRCKIAFTPGSTASRFPAVFTSTDGATTSYAGDITKGLYIWGAQVEEAASATAYQKVVSDYDVTETGQASCWGLYRDGVNDSEATAATLDLSGSDKVGVFMGVQKQQIAAQGMLLELSATIASNNGSFFQVDGGSALAGARYSAQARGTAASAGGQATDTAASFPAGSYDVVSALHDIAGDLTTVRVDGAVSGTPATGDKGAGNFGNYTLFKGARAGTSLFFSGIDFGGAIISGLTTADSALIAAIEAQIAANTPTVSI